MQKASSSPAAQVWRPNAFWLVVAAYVLVVGFGTNLLQIRYSYFTQEDAGSWGISFSKYYGDALIESVEPGSMAAEQGVEPGDILRPSDRITLRPVPLPGEEIHLTRISPPPGKSIFLVSVQADPPPMAVPNLANRVTDDAVRLLLLFGGIFILWRGWGRRSSFMLGISLAVLSPFPPQWLPFAAIEAFAWNVAAQSVFYVGTFVLVPFAMAFLAEAGIRVPRWASPLLWLGLSLAVAGLIIDVLDFPGTFPEWIYQFKVTIEQFTTLIPFALAFAVLWFGWLRGDAASRHRTALLLVAIVAISISFILYAIIRPLLQYQTDPAWLTGLSTVTRIAGLFLFAYAILRHRVIDVGFAINRTLVYGAAAFTLLAIFGLVEYIAKSMIPVAWPTAGPFISAGIAVLLFLSFHRLHHWFEHHIERLFFHHWHEAEAALRRFVDSAGHFDKPPALCRATADAVSAFAEGARSALYLRDSDGAYQLEAGGLEGAATRYGDDDPAFALMRSERKPLELAGVPGSLPGELALPMLEQGKMAGFILLEGKPDGNRFRPDERHLLGWAAHEVGLDLRALHARQLEEHNSKLQFENQGLREKIIWLEERASIG